MENGFGTAITDNDEINQPMKNTEQGVDMEISSEVVEELDDDFWQKEWDREVSTFLPYRLAKMVNMSKDDTDKLAAKILNDIAIV